MNASSARPLIGIIYNLAADERGSLRDALVWAGGIACICAIGFGLTMLLTPNATEIKITPSTEITPPTINGGTGTGVE